MTRCHIGRWPEIDPRSISIRRKMRRYTPDVAVIADAKAEPRVGRGG